MMPTYLSIKLLPPDAARKVQTIYGSVLDEALRGPFDLLKAVLAFLFEQTNSSNSVN